MKFEVFEIHEDSVVFTLLFHPKEAKQGSILFIGMKSANSMHKY